MHTTQVVLAIIGTILGIIVSVTVAAAFARANFAKAQIEALRGDRDDQAKRITRQDEEIEGLRVELKQEQAARVALEKVVTGRDILEELKTVLTEHATTTEKNSKAIFGTMEQVLDKLGEIALHLESAA